MQIAPTVHGAAGSIVESDKTLEIGVLLGTVPFVLPLPFRPRGKLSLVM